MTCVLTFTSGFPIQRHWATHDKLPTIVSYHKLFHINLASLPNSLNQDFGLKNLTQWAQLVEKKYTSESLKSV